MNCLGRHAVTKTRSGAKPTIDGSGQPNLIEHYKRYSIHTPGEASEPANGLPTYHDQSRGPREINLTRVKDTNIKEFDGRPEEFVLWRRRMQCHISDMDASYGALLDWARRESKAITDEAEDNICEGNAIGIDVR